MLQRIPFQCAAQMGTAFFCGRQQTDHSLKPVDGQLGVKDGTGGREYLLIRVFFPLNKIAEDHSGHHGACHAPLVETGGNIQIFGGGGIRPDIRNAVQAHTVLSGPVVLFLCLRVMPPGKITQFLPTAALFTGAVASAPDEQQAFVISKG